MQMRRWIIGIVAVAGLLMVYLFQKLNPAGALGISIPLHAFLFNRLIRFLLNDLFMLGLIYALFVEKKYVVFALWVQLAGVVFFLTPYPTTGR
jgi:hypothetical protein